MIVLMSTRVYVKWPFRDLICGDVGKWKSVFFPRLLICSFLERLVGGRHEHVNNSFHHTENETSLFAGLFDNILAYVVHGKRIHSIELTALRPSLSSGSIQFVPF